MKDKNGVEICKGDTVLYKTLALATLNIMTDDGKAVIGYPIGTPSSSTTVDYYFIIEDLALKLSKSECFSRAVCSSEVEVINPEEYPEHFI